ncbi:MAG: hypothetical protein KGL35_04575 [Bradyrhizobium sp.]|nr:hypothetical protein [Bradyrhizobium sp.]
MNKYQREAAILMRYAYAEEFEQHMQAATAKGLTRSRAHQPAMTALLGEHREEFNQLTSRLKPATVPNPVRRLILPGNKRDEMDPTDAVILLNRGMTVPQMAKYDNCTQMAVLRALLPQLMRRRSSYRPKEPLSRSELVEMLGARDAQIARALDELELKAA